MSAEFLDSNVFIYSLDQTDAEKHEVAELTEIYRIEADFKAKIEQALDRMIGEAAGSSVLLEAR